MKISEISSQLAELLAGEDLLSSQSPLHRQHFHVVEQLGAAQTGTADCEWLPLCLRRRSSCSSCPKRREGSPRLPTKSGRGHEVRPSGTFDAR